MLATQNWTYLLRAIIITFFSRIYGGVGSRSIARAISNVADRVENN